MPAAEPIVVYTDGACSGNPGPGGWGWAVAPSGSPSGSGGEARTTNQRMEIQAAYEAVRALVGLGFGTSGTTGATAPSLFDGSGEHPDGGPIVVVSDSAYVVNCFAKKWYVNWQRNGWKNSQRKPVANDDLWRPFIELVTTHDVTFRWVKGHSGERMNDLVDALAVAAIPR